ncbi:MAG: HEAT repeat domain-containing protein [Candidatus Omnitrophota bacterium]
MDEGNKIRSLIKNAAKLEDMQFRLLLEDLVKLGGREAEHVLGELLLTDTSIPENVRANIIWSMGYITSSSFLLVLQKVLESNESLRVRKGAIISISKFNDKRALNLLNNALKKINNPILQDSIGTEISRIKKDNPILSLMPKFLNGVNDPKTFRTTLEILKQILNPADAQVFIYHLNSDTPFVGDGAFEVLCWRGDESVKFSIFDFFKKKLKTIHYTDDPECYALQDLIMKLGKFIVRNADTINYILKELKDIYKTTKDNVIRDTLINIFSSSHKREVLSFMEDIYNTEPERREMIIEKLLGNDEGAYILIYKYKNDPDLKEKLLLSLLTTQSGADFVMANFDSIEEKQQQKILENIDPTNYKFFKELIERFLFSKDFGQKKFALDIIRKNQDNRYQNILFDPEHEKDFVRMHQDYIETITQMSFLKAFKFFINRIVNLDAGSTLTRKYLQQKNAFILAEPLVTFDPTYDLSNFADKIVKYNSRDLNLDVLAIFYNMKTFDYKTYAKVQDFLEKFKELRGAKITPEEKGMVNKVKSNLANVNMDIKAVENGNTNINHFIDKSYPDYELLEYILKNHYLSFFIQRNKVFDRIRKVFKLTNDIDAFEAIKFLLRRPDFCMYFKDEIAQASRSSNYLLKNDADKLVAMAPRSFRILLSFENENRSYYSGLETQLYDIFPEYEILRATEIQPTDILIADARSIETLAADSRLGTKRLYVLLKDRDEFAAIRDHNPKVFPPPLSFYKIVKALIPEFLPAPAPEKSGTGTEKP